MKFEITEAEAREMAKFEEEVGCDVSAGPDWGIHFDKAIDFVQEQNLLLSLLIQKNASFLILNKRR